MNTTEYAKKITEELAYTLGQVDPENGEKLTDAILSAGKILVAGAGRSGFAVKAFAMRLMHMGFNAYVVGETVTPNLEADDLFIVASGSGETGSMVVMSEKAKKIGAKLATVTIRPEGSVGRMADIVIRIPAPTPKVNVSGAFKSIQPLGSLFEQSLLLYLDAIVVRLMEKQGNDSDTMFTRHANLE